MTQTEAETRAPRVFIAYSWADREAADELLSALREQGLDVVTGFDSVSWGDNIAIAVANQIEQADAIVLLVSQASERRPWVNAEAALAATKLLRAPNSLVVPVLLEKPARPPAVLDGLRWLDLTETPSRADAIASLAMQIKARMRDETTGGGDNAAFDRLKEAAEFEEAALARSQARYEVEFTRERERERAFYTRIAALTSALTVLGLAAAAATGFVVGSSVAATITAAFATGTALLFVDRALLHFVNWLQPTKRRRGGSRDGP
jgi:TIR domain